MSETTPGITQPEYTKPVISDYGDLQKLTAAALSGPNQDLPTLTIFHFS
jgi:hypothetical protein